MTEDKCFADDYPHLIKTMPSGWNRKNYHGDMAKQKIQEFLGRRHPSDINMPLLIYNAYFNDSVASRSVFTAILKELNEFCRIHVSEQQTPGARALIKPLWKSLWDISANQFWPVVSEVYFAQFLCQLCKMDIMRFSGDIPGSGKNADVVARFKTERATSIVYFDVQHHKIKDRDAVDEQALRKMIQQHAEDKVAEKRFEKLPNDSFGVVALLYKPSDDCLGYFSGRHPVSDLIHFENNNGQKNILVRVYSLIKMIPDQKMTLVDNTVLVTGISPKT